MTSRLNPYLTFPGNAREAIEFYRTPSSRAAWASP